jgi:uncharacterized membrane protein
MGETVGMAVDVLSEIVIDRPFEQVAAYAADPSHAPDWYVNIASIEWLTEPPARVGSRTAGSPCSTLTASATRSATEPLRGQRRAGTDGHPARRGHRRLR